MPKPTTVVTFSIVAVACLLVTGRSVPLPWPESPLNETPANDPNWVAPANMEEAMAAMAGHYAHYVIVAYNGKRPTARLPLSSFHTATRTS